jgi:signal transduction histidine kinase
MSKELPVILYVDDEIDNITVVKGDLEHKFNVVGIDKPRVALEKVQEIKPCIVVSDIDMPHMDGIEFLEKLKVVYPQARRVIITGKSTESTAIEAIRRTGSSEYIKKPFKGDALERALDKVYKSYTDDLIEDQKRKKEQEATEQKIVELMSSLEQSQQLALLGTLTTGIFEELSQPIDRAGSWLSLIETTAGRFERLKESNLAFQQKILDAAQRGRNDIKLVIGICRNLMSYANAKNATADYFGLEAVVQTVYELLYSKAHEKNISLKCDISKKVMINGNKAGFYQIIMHLVSNAIDASKIDGSLEISSKAEEESWQLVIQYDGEGVLEENLTKVFDPYASTKTSPKGKGLGLFVVRKEVERHAGTIEIRSVVGKGTAFVLKFPRASRVGEETT